ncbi:hypothetical protein [Pararhizobium sp. LjRoot238]|uniref:hypothetical protein n=1 Tax=Pararhizobium sp. LjRoot238 TaxID=3342293 RepID=UPI003ECFD228
MTISPSIVQVRRAILETCIEKLIDLLDRMDGDENLEPYLADFDPRCLNDLEAEITDEPHDGNELKEDVAECDCPGLILVVRVCNLPAAFVRRIVRSVTDAKYMLIKQLVMRENGGRGVIDTATLMRCQNIIFLAYFSYR